MQGAPKEDLLSPEFAPRFAKVTALSLAPKIRDIVNGQFRNSEPTDIKGSGYVIERLNAALWVFWNSSSFREGALMAVNLGDGADTTGAIFGQLAGAHYGTDRIPDSWLSKLAWRDRLTRTGGGGEQQATLPVLRRWTAHPRQPGTLDSN